MISGILLQNSIPVDNGRMSKVYAVPYEGSIVEGDLDKNGFVIGWHLDDDDVIQDTRHHRSQYLKICDDFSCAVEVMIDRDGERILSSA